LLAHRAFFDATFIARSDVTSSFLTCSPSLHSKLSVNWSTENCYAFFVLIAEGHFLGSDWFVGDYLIGLLQTVSN
jgi:hypothetical protein